MKKIFNGIIKQGDDSEFLIGGEIVASILEEENINGSLINLRYTISDNEINPETVEEDVYKNIFGLADVEHGCIPFSEWTGFVAWDDTFIIGNHNLMDELLNYEGKYCYLEVWTEENQ